MIYQIAFIINQIDEIQSKQTFYYSIFIFYGIICCGVVNTPLYAMLCDNTENVNDYSDSS